MISGHPAVLDNGPVPPQPLDPDRYAEIVTALRNTLPPKRRRTIQDERAKTKRIEKRRARKKAGNRTRRAQRRK